MWALELLDRSKKNKTTNWNKQRNAERDYSFQRFLFSSLTHQTI